LEEEKMDEKGILRRKGVCVDPPNRIWIKMTTITNHVAMVGFAFLLTLGSSYG